MLFLEKFKKSDSEIFYRIFFFEKFKKFDFDIFYRIKYPSRGPTLNPKIGSISEDLLGVK